MRLALIAGSAAAAMTVLAQPAQAVSSRVSGKYAYQQIEMCEAKLIVQTQNVLVPPPGTPGTAQGVKSVTSAQTGLISAGVGYITFTATTTTTGHFSLSGSIVEGGSLRLNNIGFTMNTTADSGSGTWSINSATDPTSVTITPTGGSAQTYTLRYGNLSTTAPTTGIARTFYLVRKDTVNGNNTNCVTTINGTRQTP
jgi:methenyltetrahydromethanopterin cyclohydrolase